MKKVMLINAVHPEQKRMAIVENGRLVEYNVQMSVRENITGNIYKGIVMKVEKGLHAAFVNYGGRKDGFLPLKDVSPEYFRVVGEGSEDGRRYHTLLRPGQEVLVQVLRDVGEKKGALLTTYISLPGRYLVLLPNKSSAGISRKIEGEEDRRRLREIMSQINLEEGMGFIVRTAGISRTKQELLRDYQHLYRLWKQIQKLARELPAPALIYQESDFGIRSLRDYYTSDIEAIWVDDIETFRKMREYLRIVSPRNQNIIKLYVEKIPIFDKYEIEEQVNQIYQERVNLRSGGYIVIKPTEAMTTIDVNSGKASNKKNIEETAFRTNLEAAEEIARQLRLRDIGGLIAIDFIDMKDRYHRQEVERAFKRAISLDRARIQMLKISKFGILELSRQRRHSNIQEICFVSCPHCKGTGLRPTVEYLALGVFRKIESKAVTGEYTALKVSLPLAIADYLLNNKRSELLGLEAEYGMSIRISGNLDLSWDEVRIECIERDGLMLNDGDLSDMGLAGVQSDFDLWNTETECGRLADAFEVTHESKHNKKHPRRMERGSTLHSDTNSAYQVVCSFPGQDDFVPEDMDYYVSQDNAKSECKELPHESECGDLPTTESVVTASKSPDRKGRKRRTLDKWEGSPTKV
ncbi:MAG: Rne/Rng family ribonuclease [Syntrophales bacterium]|nr:Rne/Rng family ribonuclease [Syntrophales bacterium]